MDRIENREALEQVREASKAQIENSKCRILICAGTGCLAGGSGKIYERMCELVKEHPDVEVHFGPEIAHGDGEIGVKKSGCHGFCEMGPVSYTHLDVYKRQGMTCRQHLKQRRQ